MVYIYFEGEFSAVLYIYVSLHWISMSCIILKNIINGVSCLQIQHQSFTQVGIQICSPVCGPKQGQTELLRALSSCVLKTSGS